MARTSQLKTRNKTPNNSRGFTLIEIMIVLAILAGMVIFAINRIAKPQTNIKAVTRQLTTLMREVRNDARIKRRTYRIVFNVSAGNEAHSYWVESAPGATFILSKEQQEELAKLAEDKKAASPFQLEAKYTKKPKTLPSGLYFGRIETQSAPDGLENGKLYIYISEHGLVEKSAVQITNRDRLTWTLIFNPLTGHADIVDEPMGLKDLKVD